MAMFADLLICVVKIDNVYFYDPLQPTSDVGRSILIYNWSAIHSFVETPARKDFAGKDIA